MNYDTYSPMRNVKRRFAAIRAHMRETATAVRRTEGERGIALRWSVGFRYGVYLLGILATAAVVGAYPPLGVVASSMVIISSVTVIVSAAVATLLYPTERRALVDQMRFFVFGTICFPAVVVGALLTAVTSTGLVEGFATGTNTDNLIITITQNALPYVFWGTVVIPPFIFVKTVVGLHKLHRDRNDDEESVNQWTRQHLPSRNVPHQTSMWASGGGFAGESVYAHPGGPRGGGGMPLH